MKKKFAVTVAKDARLFLGEICFKNKRHVLLQVFTCLPKQSIHFNNIQSCVWVGILKSTNDGINTNTIILK